MRLPLLVAAVAASLALFATAPANASTSVQACADVPAPFCVSVLSADGGPAGEAGSVCVGTGCAAATSAIVVCTPYQCLTFLTLVGAAGETGVICVGTACPA